MEALATEALTWMIGAARDTGDGLVWAATATSEEPDHTLYSGGAGIVLTLLEAERHLRDDRYGDAALRGAAALAAAAEGEQECSLYFGLTGIAVALRAVHHRLGDPASGTAATRALNRVRQGFDGRRWGPMFELLFGNAGIALGALHAGGLDLAVLAVEPYRENGGPRRRAG